MKRILLLLISTIVLHSIGIHAEGVNREIKGIQAFGEEIRQELEKNLAIEFKKRSDEIFETVMADDVNQKRFKANCTVDLLKVLDASMSEVMVAKIVEFLKKAEDEVSKLIKHELWNKWVESQKRGVSWPHSPQFRRQNERLGFIFRPMIIKRDRLVCDACGAEPSGLQEVDSEKYNCDLPQYFHKINCSTFNGRPFLTQIDAYSDSKLSVQQRIKFALGNYFSEIDVKALSEVQRGIARNYKIECQNNEFHPDIAQSLDQAIPIPDILKIISAYFGYINKKVLRFMQFYSAFGQLPGWVMVDEFISNGGSTSGDRIRTCTVR